MTSPLTEHRDRVAAAQRAAERAVRDLWLDVYDPDAAIVRDLIRNAPEAVIAACGRLANKEKQ